MSRLLIDVPRQEPEKHRPGQRPLAKVERWSGLRAQSHDEAAALRG